MIAAVHLSLRMTVPIALLIVVGLAWYWTALAEDEVPASRRRVRRLSMVLMLASLPAFVLGLSVFDPAVDQIAYVIAWLVAIALVFLVFLSALLDVAVSMRIQRERYERDMRQAAAELREAMETQRERQRDQPQDAASAFDEDAERGT
jgi:hypothetical protein